MRLSLQTWIASVAIVGIILNIWIMLRNRSDVEYWKGIKKFYIYDWPKSVSDSWPDKCSHHRISIHNYFRDNYGAGQLVDRDHGLYHTHQYSVYEIFYQRLLLSPLRTLNPAEASLFFIPYDLGMDATTRASDGALAQTNCPRGKHAIDLLRQSPYFMRSRGADHVMVHSINQMMVFYANDKCTPIYELCYNCTKLSIDTYPSGMYTHLDRRSYLSHNWISIPFPSNYHHSENVSAPLWRAISQVPRYMHGPYQEQRSFALCFVGSATVTAKLQRQLRLELISTCQVYSVDCLYIPLLTHQSHESIFTATASVASATPLETSVSINPLKASLLNASSFALNKENNPYAQAKFCLTPGGDFPTRKGFFDALLSGCVPVIFERTTALTQWPLHWQASHSKSEHLHGKSEHSPRSLASECTVYVPREVAMRNMTDTFAYLIKLSRDVLFMERRLECIAAVGVRMQYTLHNAKPSDHHVTHDKDSDFKDAVDVVLDHLLHN